MTLFIIALAVIVLAVAVFFGVQAYQAHQYKEMVAQRNHDRAVAARKRRQASMDYCAYDKSGRKHYSHDYAIALEKARKADYAEEVNRTMRKIDKSYRF